MRTDTNERAEVQELRGVAAENLRGALLEMEAVSAGARTGKPFYHASINTRADERLTEEQRAHAIDRLETELGLSGQARVVVIHQKEGREHCHIVWSRIDLDRMRAISDSHNYRKHEQVARDLEREFGHERVQGAHIEREGKERPERTPSHAEMLQAERTGLSAKEVKEKITELWHRTDNGKSFAVALWESGYVLAHGDQRDFVVIDPKGGTHSLARRVEGAKVKDIRERMTDLDRDRLPNVTDAKQLQKLRQDRDATRAQESPKESSRQAPREAPQADRVQKGERPASLNATNRPADGFGRAAVSMLDGLASIFERALLGEGETHRDREKDEEPPVRNENQQPDPVRAHEDEKSRLRQALLQEFGREIENQQEAEFERGRERQRRGE
jgi:hypothetical protein